MNGLEHAIRELYGTLPTGDRTVHVVSAARGPDAALHVILIGPDAPKSARDFLVLQLARARADAVLTTAQILRAEPELSFAFVGPFAAELAQYRRALGKQALTICILTLKGDVPLDHPFWSEPNPKLVFTSHAHAARLALELEGRADVVGVAAPAPRKALDELRRRGHRAIGIEAGPTAVRSLYDDPTVIDELWLSRVEIRGLDPRHLGHALPPEETLLRGRTCASSVAFEEQSGPFRFERWVRLP